MSTLCSFIGHHFHDNRCIGCGAGQRTRTVDEIRAAIDQARRVRASSDDPRGELIWVEDLCSALSLPGSGKGRGDE